MKLPGTLADWPSGAHFRGYNLLLAYVLTEDFAPGELCPDQEILDYVGHLILASLLSPGACFPAICECLCVKTNGGACRHQSVLAVVQLISPKVSMPVSIQKEVPRHCDRARNTTLLLFAAFNQISVLDGGKNTGMDVPCGQALKAFSHIEKPRLECTPANTPRCSTDSLLQSCAV
eukprot:1160340-Pelagomonas_calceolata.AAC.3